MEGQENEAKEWLQDKLPNVTWTVETQNEGLYITGTIETESGTDTSVSFRISQDNETWMVWSENEVIQSQLGRIVDFCESTKPTSIQQLLDNMCDILNKALKLSEKDNDDDGDDSEDEEVDDYYNDDDNDDAESAVASALTTADNEANATAANYSSDDSDDDRFFGGITNAAACQRLMKDLKSMKKEAHKFCIEGNPRGNNLFVWDVKLTNFPADTRLGQDISEWAKRYNREPVVYLEMQFPGDYPMNPPFVRVIRPRFKFLTGHVTIGGSICMEMLTSTGWTATNDIESILVQIRCEIMSDSNTRLDKDPDREYNETEARDAFNRMVARYGWNKT